MIERMQPVLMALLVFVASAVLVPLLALGTYAPCESCYAGTPISSKHVLLLENTGYTVGYSDSLRNPLWVAYRLFRVEDPASYPRPSSFSVDYRTTARVSHKDYTNSGYDRGHMAPNASIGYCYGQSAQRNTFLMSNVVPQTPTLNSGIWSTLDNLIWSWANAFDEVWVVTGPIFCHDGQRLQSGVPVPCEFYKIVVDVFDGAPRMIAFIIPNDVEKGRKPVDFLFSVSEVEARTGFDFFWQLEDELETTLGSHLPTSLWSIPYPPSPTCCDAYVASTRSAYFHHASCEWAARILDTNMICLCTREDAVFSQRIPCPTCKP